MTRRFKIVDELGRTTNCATHDLDEVARAVVSARDHGERISVRYGDGHRLRPPDFLAVVEAAGRIIEGREADGA